MPSFVTLAVDAMGGDHGFQVIIPAVLLALNEDPHLRVLLVGDQAILSQALTSFCPTIPDRLQLVHAPDVVAMSEPPSHALRNKKQSSMRIAVDLVRDQKALGCVSAGNTGALMAIGCFVLKTLDSIERPAILARIPRNNGYTLLLDGGANIDSPSERLHQFALMGSAAARLLTGIHHPKVALLNVGVEENKGCDRVKLANELLRNEPRINYIGYVEGNDIFTEKSDVVVCDGFVGNVVLKTSEGVVRYILGRLQGLSALGWRSKLLSWLLTPFLRQFMKNLDPGNFNGASLIGLKGVVVKSHGAANVMEFARAIHLAANEVRQDIAADIERALAESS